MPKSTIAGLNSNCTFSCLKTTKLLPTATVSFPFPPSVCVCETCPRWMSFQSLFSQDVLTEGGQLSSDPVKLQIRRRSLRKPLPFLTTTADITESLLDGRHRAARLPLYKSMNYLQELYGSVLLSPPTWELRLRNNVPCSRLHTRSEEEPGFEPSSNHHITLPPV